MKNSKSKVVSMEDILRNINEGKEIKENETSNNEIDKFLNELEEKGIEIEVDTEGDILEEIDRSVECAVNDITHKSDSLLNRVFEIAGERMQEKMQKLAEELDEVLSKCSNDEETIDKWSGDYDCLAILMKWNTVLETLNEHNIGDIPILHTRSVVADMLKNGMQFIRDGKFIYDCCAHLCTTPTSIYDSHIFDMDCEENINRLKTLLLFNYSLEEIEETSIGILDSLSIDNTCLLILDAESGIFLILKQKEYTNDKEDEMLEAMSIQDRQLKQKEILDNILSENISYEVTLYEGLGKEVIGNIISSDKAEEIYEDRIKAKEEAEKLIQESIDSCEIRLHYEGGFRECIQITNIFNLLGFSFAFPLDDTEASLLNEFERTRLFNYYAEVIKENLIPYFENGNELL